MTAARTRPVALVTGAAGGIGGGIARALAGAGFDLLTSTTTEKYDALIAAGFVPAGRWGDTAEVGRAVAMLARGELSYATGQTIHVDGGMRFKAF